MRLRARAVDRMNNVRSDQRWPAATVLGVRFSRSRGAQNEEEAKCGAHQ